MTEPVHAPFAARRAAGAVAAGPREAVGAVGGTVWSRDEWVAVTYPATDDATHVGLLLILGISLVNTMLVATSDQMRDLAALRLTGAATGQVLRLVGAEALTVVAVGAVLGVAVATLNLADMWGALHLLSVQQVATTPVRAVQGR